MAKEKIIRKSNRTLNLFADGGGTKQTWGQQAKSSGQSAFSGQNLGSTMGGIGSAVDTIVNAGIQNARIADTSNLEEEIKQAQTYTVQANNNDDLMSEWSIFTPMKNVSWKDIRGGSTGQRIGNTINATNSGVSAGASVGGPIGAIVGGVVGLGSAIGGWISGNSKAKKKARKFNNQINAANEKNLVALGNKAENIDTQNDLNMLASFSAYGGPVNIFGSGAIDYELAKEDLYNKQLSAMSKYKLSSMPNSFEVPKIDTFAEGGRIYIKPENRGKFTALKKRTGKSATWFKKHGTPAQKKMATFALNARKWKHELGGNLYKDGGPEDKKVKRVDFSTYKPLFNRGFIPENMEQLQDSLVNRGYNDAQRLAILANVLHESGGDPKAVSDSGRYKGIIQWGPERYPNTEDLGEQIHELIEEANTPSSPAWSDGGGGIPFIKNLQQGYDNFWESGDPYNATLYYTKGSVRPKDQKARINRAEEARNMFKNLKANGGSLTHQHGGNFSNGVTIIGNGGLHEQNPMEGVPMGIAPDGTSNLVEQGEVKFNDYIFSNRLFATGGLLASYNLPTTYENHSFADIAERLSKESSERPNDPISKNGLTSSMERLRQAQEQVRIEKQNRQFARGGYLFATGGPEGIDPLLDEEDDNLIIPTGSKILGNLFSYDNTNYQPPVISNNPIINSNGSTTKVSNDIKPEQNKEVEKDKTTKTSPIEDETSLGYSYGPTWLRYAPVVGAGLGVLSDTLGWTNKPDYSNADLVGNIANNIANIEISPIGNYLTYRPFDRNFYLNKLNAQAGATRRAIMNTTSPSRNVALLAADYNAQGRLGDLARQAEEYNMAQRERVEAFNRGTNQFNSELALKADIANQRSDELRLRARIAQAQLRDQADARASAGRSANLTNLFDSLGAIGNEEVQKDWMKMLAFSGYFGTLSSKPNWMSKRDWKNYQDSLKKKENKKENEEKEDEEDK